MISKETFIKILTDLKDLRTKWDALQSAAEALSDGCYVDFWPYLRYEEMIETLLNETFNYGMSETYSWSPISTYMIEGNYGAEVKYLIDKEDNFDISTPEKLYEYYLRQLEENYDGK